MSYTALELGAYSWKARHIAMRRGVTATGGRTLNVTSYDKLHAIIAETSPRFAFTSGMHAEEAYARGVLRALDVPLLVLDCGWFKRASGPQDTEGHNQVCVDSLNSPAEGSYDASRWRLLDLPAPRPPRGRGRYALFLGQVPNDSQHGMNADQLGVWFTEQRAVLACARMNVVYRPHPACKGFAFAWGMRLCEEPTLEKAFDECSLVVTYNSTAGLEAIMHGLPVVCSPRAHYAKIAGYGFGDVPLETVMHYVQRLAWNQWTCAEIAAGLPIRQLFP